MCLVSDSSNFSVLMSIYVGNKPEELNEALLSIESQTLLPSEVVIVEDGFIGDELKKVIQKYKGSLNIVNIVNIVLGRNMGHGYALNKGLSCCSNELVARMDGDDIAHVDRFEIQVQYMMNNKNVSVSSGIIEEFVDNVSNVVGSRRLPTEHRDILKFARFRSPMNHPATIFRKSDVLSVGGYPEMHPENYPLWCLMLSKGFLFSNINKVLLSMRVGTNFQSRRGFSFFLSEVGMVKYQYRIGFISFSNMALSLALRLLFRILPSTIRSMVYRAR